MCKILGKISYGWVLNPPVRIQIKIHSQLNYKELRLTLKEVAESTQLTSSFLSQVENSKVNLSLNSLHLITDALDVPVTYFMADE
ncbi:MAG: hypothetical protein CVU41_13075 [Chloroflexi bacterium HGW-Chloroflexi-3]|nr:MAG: hypothetical protein CVU41_13075 [Chloroflexi bacterium HGW-Chloroflexi-3]